MAQYIYIGNGVRIWKCKIQCDLVINADTETRSCWTADADLFLALAPAHSSVCCTGL